MFLLTKKLTATFHFATAHICYVHGVGPFAKYYLSRYHTHFLTLTFLPASHQIKFKMSGEQLLLELQGSLKVETTKLHHLNRDSALRRISKKTKGRSFQVFRSGSSMARARLTPHPISLPPCSQHLLLKGREYHRQPIDAIRKWPLPFYWLECF